MVGSSSPTRMTAAGHPGNDPRATAHALPIGRETILSLPLLLPADFFPASPPAAHRAARPLADRSPGGFRVYARTALFASPHDRLP